MQKLLLSDKKVTCHLGRVDLHDLGRLEGLGLPADLDVDLVTVHRVDHGLVEATLAIRHPDRFLGVCSRKKFWKLKNTNKSISP